MGKLSKHFIPFGYEICDACRKYVPKLNEDVEAYEHYEENVLIVLIIVVFANEHMHQVVITNIKNVCLIHQNQIAMMHANVKQNGCKIQQIVTQQMKTTKKNEW